MLTKSDKQFLTENFATKDDFKNLAKQKDLLRVESKVDSLDTRVSSIEQKLDQLTEYVMPTLGGILKWTDDIHKAIIGKPLKIPHEN